MCKQRMFNEPIHRSKDLYKMSVKISSSKNWSGMAAVQLPYLQLNGGELYWSLLRATKEKIRLQTQFFFHNWRWCVRILVTCYFISCSSQIIRSIVVVTYTNAFFTKYFGLKELVLKLLSYLFCETNAKYWSSACDIHGKKKPSITADIAYLGSVPELWVSGEYSAREATAATWNDRC
jgi:hypothetical protein